MTEQQKDSILLRIKKLLAMTTERGATPEEAATAAAKAQQLLMEHNLSMAAVEEAGGEKGENVGKHTYDMTDGKDQSLHWRRSLLNVVVRYNFCKLITNVDGLDRRTAIIGKKSNVEVAIYIYEHVQREIHKMAKAYQKLQSFNKSMFYTSFCLGAVNTILERLKNQEEQMTKANPKANALVVVNTQQLSTVTKQYFPILGKGRAMPSVKRADGYELGKREAKNISLNKGLTSTANPTGAIKQIGGK